jgi:hypothetical protein
MVRTGDGMRQREARRGACALAGLLSVLAACGRIGYEDRLVSDAGTFADAALVDGGSLADGSPSGNDGSPSDPDGSSGTDDCTGALHDGVCWHMGARGESCIEVCAGRGGYDAATEQVVGTFEQGGSAAGCQGVLAALQETGNFREGYRDDGIGAGCHRWFAGQSPQGDLWWLTSPEFDPSTGAPQAAIACGCVR